MAPFSARTTLRIATSFTDKYSRGITASSVISKSHSSRKRDHARSKYSSDHGTGVRVPSQTTVT